MSDLHTTRSTERLTCATETAPEAMVLRPAGEIFLQTVPMLWSDLYAMLEDNCNVVVDLSRIQSIDSSGLQALLDVHQLFIQRGQRFVLAEPSAACRKVFGTGADTSMHTFESVEAALRSFRSPVGAQSGSTL
jgi:anti-anti-sigma factor